MAWALLGKDSRCVKVFLDRDADISTIVKGNSPTFDTQIDLTGVPAGEYSWATAIVNTEQDNVPGIELAVKDSYLTAEGWVKLCEVTIK